MLSRIFARLEGLVEPIVDAPVPPPRGLLAFIRVQIGQVRWPLIAYFGFVVLDALFDALVPFFIGKLVTLLTTVPRDRFLAEAGPVLVTMLIVVLIVRPAIFLCGFALGRVGIEPGLQSRLRWQFYSRLAGQSLTFFHNDFAGRLANRVMQTGGAVRQAVMSFIQAIIYIVFYAISAFGLIALQDWRMAIPIAIWFCLYLTVLKIFMPQQRARAQAASESRSLLMGKVVDGFGNAQTLKLFGEKSREDAYMSNAVREANRYYQAQQRLQLGLSGCLSLLSASTVAGTASIGIWLWLDNRIEVGGFAMAMTLVLSLVRASGWIAFEIAGIMENVGVIQEGMQSLTAPVTLLDRSDAVPLKTGDGDIRFENLTFNYGSGRTVLHEINIHIRPGEKVGLVGRSGAGKSTLVNLLLRFHDVTSGRILIDGQDIASVKQESLRHAIAMVTQDTSLLHRSIRENIAYGRPQAAEAEILKAATDSKAAEFIPNLSDWLGRTGYDAHVGERGVKLSGGQRQRIAIARVILKQAPILVLDEATSALDSEVEAAIQESLTTLMAGKTVIAIAHRLSTLQIMDRLIILDEGRILEEGTHESLLAKGGLYADLWMRQSGGFLLPQKRVG